jgi:ATP-dependent DNA helicase UvrD/PcrA
MCVAKVSRKHYSCAVERASSCELNERQRQAAQHGNGSQAGPLLVVAGAGTGKTNTLAHRVAHLLCAGVDPDRILLLTFSRRAAVEMSRRTQRIVGDLKHNVRFRWSGTFHSIANRLLRQRSAAVGLDPAFSVIDRGDAADLMDVVRHELGFSSARKRFPRKDTCLAIYSHRVNTQRPLEETLASMFPWCAEWEESLSALYRAYVERKLANQVLDYDDLLLYWHAMMSDAALAAEIGAGFDHVLVDEYQDTNVLQAEILIKLRPTGEGVTVVGDDAQAIYSFRAATVENILGFPFQYAKTGGPDATVVTLEENYRSTQRVLDAANALIGEAKRQYHKVLRSRRGCGEPPRHITVVDDQAQAEYVATCVLDARERGIDLKRQAVLFRSSHHSDTLELELTRRNIPFVKYGGLKFLEAGHVKDMLSVLRWADNPKNRLAAFRALQLLPGIGPATAERLLDRFEQSGYSWTDLSTTSGAGVGEPWTEFMDLVLALVHPDAPWQGQVTLVRRWFEPHLERIYEAAQVRTGDLLQLERIAEQFATREQFLTELALDPPQATGDLSGPPYLDEDYLILSTVHSAKGQEWESVYVLNVADGEFPSEFSTGNAEQLEEERRLLYVAMTRAKTELHLISPLKYYVPGQSKSSDKHVYGAKSRFLTKAVMSKFQPSIWPIELQGSPSVVPGAARVDVAAKLRALW